MNLLEINVVPQGRSFDWILKIKEGKFEQIKDLYIDVVGY